MNLFLFNENDLIDNGHFTISDHRASHLINVLGATVGQRIRAGEIDGMIGEAHITSIHGATINLSWQEIRQPPPPLPCILILALPRPKMLSRILEATSAMGIKKIHLINTWKVDKSYWKSPKLEEQRIRSHLIAGLEQAVDTVLPKVSLHRLFKPFAEDLLPALCSNRKAVVAHPYAAEHCPQIINETSTLAIGPEGGFTDYEIDLLQQAGMIPAHFGPRILRTETALPAILTQLHPASSLNG